MDLLEYFSKHGACLLSRAVSMAYKNIGMSNKDSYMQLDTGYAILTACKCGAEAV